MSTFLSWVPADMLEFPYKVIYDGSSDPCCPCKSVILEMTGKCYLIERGRYCIHKSIIIGPVVNFRAFIIMTIQDIEKLYLFNKRTNAGWYLLDQCQYHNTFIEYNQEMYNMRNDKYIKYGLSTWSSETVCNNNMLQDLLTLLVPKIEGPYIAGLVSYGTIIYGSPKKMVASIVIVKRLCDITFCFV